jgi:hypothetical protein
VADVRWSAEAHAGRVMNRVHNTEREPAAARKPSRALVFTGTLIQVLGMAAGLVRGAPLIVQSIREGRRG